MTPSELEAALRGAFGLATPAPLSRSDLAALMDAYPDD
jgi:tail assembly chaperone